MHYGHREGAERDAEFAREALPWLDDVQRFARALARNEPDADDVVQETFLRAYRSWHTFELGSDCRKWLFTICRNVFLRSRTRDRNTVDLDDPEGETMAAVLQHNATGSARYDEVFAQMDVVPAVKAAIDEVPEPYRSATVLVDLEGLSYDEAAEVLGVPIGTVRSRLFRARRILQAKLLDFAKDAGYRA